jgi:Zn-finger protein
MLQDAPVKQVSDCKVCFAPHNEEIHEATLRIHRWFQQQVTKNFWEESVVESELVLEEQVA